MPLIARGALKGALNIYRIGEHARFAEHEFELAKWFGDAAALALDNAQVRERLVHQAQTDSLTGLYNHRFFQERLRAELTRAHRSHDAVAVLMFDIDDFKKVNDIYGHGVGDQLLVAARRASRATRFARRTSSAGSAARSSRSSCPRATRATRSASLDASRTGFATPTSSRPAGSPSRSASRRAPSTPPTRASSSPAPRRR